MDFLKSAKAKILFHLSLSIVLGIGFTLFFFHGFLPSSTNHGESITVPNVVGLHLDELDDFLTNRRLRYEISEDSSYSADFKPLEVLKQFPLPNAKVKENRKIYLTLNTVKPPLVKMPNLIDGSIKNAQIVLKSYDLRLGKITYIPDEIFNTVLKQELDGREVLPNEQVAKGSIIDIVSGDGLGVVSLQTPNLVGLDEESARIAIVGSGLNVGDVAYDKEGRVVIAVTNNDGSAGSVVKTIAPGAVYKQFPDPGKVVRLKEFISLWVYKPDSINTKPTLLDE